MNSAPLTRHGGSIGFPRSRRRWVRTRGDEEFKIETQTNIVVSPGTIHAFGLRNGRVLKSVSILSDADAVPGHRVIENGESFEMPEAKQK